MIKDLGVVVIDGGWEMYIGGNGGLRVRAADLMWKVKMEEEVLEYTAANLQNTVKLPSGTSEWVQRIGLAVIREALDTEAKRKALAARIDQTLSLTTDPWKEIIANKELRSMFEPLQSEEASAAKVG